MKHNPAEKYNLCFHEPITEWEKAIPIGNGRIGALIYGKPEALRFSLDRSEIWDTTVSPDCKSPEFTFQNMILLVNQGEEEAIRRIFDAPYQQPRPTKLPTGALTLHLGGGRLCSTLHLHQAEAVFETGHLKVEAFLHAKENIGWIRIHTIDPDDGLTQLRYDFIPPAFGEISAGCYEEAQEIHLDGCRGFVQQITETFFYGIFVKQFQTPKYWYLIYTVACSSDGTDWVEACCRHLNRASQEGYQKARGVHRGWWAEFWEKSDLELPDPFFQKNWYLSCYFLGCCSRKGGYPMPLQGLWTADNGKLPPWKGDYHHDLNTEMSYFSYLKANHLEEGECFLDYLWKLQDKGRKFAASFYGKKGSCLPAAMTITGDPLGGWGMYSLSPTQQIFLCQAFDQYYRYTARKDFLRERAYPYLRETGQLISALLEEKDGQLYLPVSSSPEIHDDTLAAFLKPNSNYDLALLRFLFATLSEYAAEVKPDEEEKWEQICRKLPQLAVDTDHVLMLCQGERLQESHRHHSHMMAIYPLRLLTLQQEEDRKIIEASVADLERLGTGYWVGFSFPWAAQFRVILHQGNAAWQFLNQFWRAFCSDNGFHLNGDFRMYGLTTFHYSPFTLEACFCAADALQEMLLYCENGRLELFPAIPDHWKQKKISFRDFRAKGGLLVSACLQHGRVVFLKIHWEQDAKLLVQSVYFRDKDLEGDAVRTPEGYVLQGHKGEERVLLQHFRRPFCAVPHLGT